jgi:hypothetical protein
MGRPPIRLTAEEQEQIVGMLRQGMSVRKVARSVGRGESTVSRIANQYGLNTARLAQQKATETGETYDRIRRAAVWDDVIAHLHGLLPMLDKPGSAYNYAMGLAIATDKRRQEEVTEQAGTKGAVIELVSRLVRQDRPADAEGIVDINRRENVKDTA